MTKTRLAIAATAAALMVGAAGAASAQRITSMGYVDSFVWKINHAADTGQISEYQRRNLLALERRTQTMAWRCNTSGGYVCDRVAQNVNYINDQLNRSSYGYGYGRHWGY